MRSILVIALAVLLFAACKKVKLPGGLPACMSQKIIELQMEPVRNPPAKVIEYTYEEKIYYYIPPYCCDAFSEAYDQDCDLICHPDGGLTGSGDGQCPESFLKATQTRVIWEDERK